jgi:hypothetical protein
MVTADMIAATGDRPQAITLCQHATEQVVSAPVPAPLVGNVAAIVGIHALGAAEFGLVDIRRIPPFLGAFSLRSGFRQPAEVKDF